MTRSTKWFCGLLALFCAVQALVASRTLGYFPEGFATEDFYDPLARNLLAHGTYSLDASNAPITDRPPLYPVALAGLYALFGAHEAVGVAANNLLLAVLLVATFLIGRRLHPIAAIAGPALVMIDTVFLAQANRNQSDMLFACLATLFVWLAVRSLQRPLDLGAVALAAIALSLAVFTRAVGMYLWAAYAIGLFAAFRGRAPMRRVVAAVALVGALQVAVVAPWMWRNHTVSGNADYAGMKGHHLVSFYAPLYLAKRDGVDPKEAKSRLWTRIDADPAYQMADKGGRERYLAALGVRLAMENWPLSLVVLLDNLPQLFLSFPAEPLAVLLGPEAFEKWRQFDEGRHVVSFSQDSWALGPRLEQIRYYWSSGLAGVLAYGIAMKATNALALVLSAWGLIAMWRDSRPEVRRLAVFLLLYVAVLTVLSSLATQGRFRMPIMPVVAVMAGYGGVRLAAALRRSAGGDPAGLERKA